MPAAIVKKKRIKLVKSLNGRKKSHIATAISLGLKRPGDETLQPDNDATQGKLHHIGYLVSVTDQA
ncbi:MAG: 50S ribosomal protein L30 [Oscillospiraceae bacterium]|jgi:large subunit ribosomal protein L30|nr:50S ribosomal protein L30 [Oscillospiraceae bacterium]